MGYGVVEIHFTSLGGMRYKKGCSLNDARNNIRMNHFHRYTVDIPICVWTLKASHEMYECHRAEKIKKK